MGTAKLGWGVEISIELGKGPLTQDRERSSRGHNDGILDSPTLANQDVAEVWRGMSGCESPAC